MSGTSEDVQFELPSSSAALGVVQATQSSDVRVDDLASMVEADPGFTLRLLSMVNSPAYGGRFTVGSVPQAAARLGVKGLRRLALSLAVADLAPEDESGSAALSLCLRRAAAARSIAEVLGGADPDAAFATGMILDVGLMLGRDSGQMLTLANSPAHSRILREEADGLTKHTSMGKALAVRLRLPADMAQAIVHHHDTEPPDGGLARIAWAAERVAAVYEGGPIADLRDEAIAAASKIALATNDIEHIVTSLPEQVTAAAQALQREVGDQQSYESILVDANRALRELNTEYESVLHQMSALLEAKEQLAKQLKETNERLDRIASTDELTGLPNRRLLFETLNRDLARAQRDQGVISVVVVDIDHFKSVNDTYGHPAGDKVLAAVAGVLAEGVRGGDLAARYGGEEFALLLPATTAARAVAVAERVRRAVAELKVETEAGVLSVTASFGVAAAHGLILFKGAEAVFKRADEALYAAKRGGRNRVERAEEPKPGSRAKAS